MGQEIAATRFGPDDFASFAGRLDAETALARAMFERGQFSGVGPVGGFELEAWLIDRAMAPAPDNQSFLAHLDDPLVVAELSRFNIELNGTPQPLAGEGLLRMEAELSATWARCVAMAHRDVDTAIAIGTLPTLRDSDLCLANMTPSNRYVALNRQVMQARGGAAVEVEIDSVLPGGTALKSRHSDVMLEAGTTSFQLHWQVPAADVARALDASIQISAPLLALSANSPFLFGRALWHETRIALFEQALGGHELADRRVSFGSGYAGHDPVRMFDENRADYPALLPLVQVGEPPARFAHLRLHNGTIWRWNRLLVGFDADEAPHLRIEQRVMPAGPSVRDMFANAAFFYGAAHELARAAPVMPFETAKANFYAAARQGLGALLDWPGGDRRPAWQVLAELLPLARRGLEELGAASEAIDRYLDVAEQRIAARRNGAEWQLAHFVRHADLRRLTADYLEHQRSGMPVHEWVI